MSKLKPYWFKQGVGKVWIAQDIHDPWTDEYSYSFEPGSFSSTSPGACLFSRLERTTQSSNDWVKVWLYQSKFKKDFLDESEREKFSFWVSRSLLVEISL